MSNIDRLRSESSTFLHYTSLEAFYNIMDTGRLRFTSAKSTNDPSEFLFGKEIVDRALEEIIPELNARDQQVVSECKTDLPNRDFRAFVFCMSEALENEEAVGELSQWRLYGGDGRGIALVFDVSDSIRRSLMETQGSIPRKVIYGEEEGLALVKDEIKAYFAGIGQLPKSELDQLYRENMTNAGYLGNRLFWLPSVIKHKAYSHEREVRLIRGDIGERAGNPLIFTERGSIRRPAIELPMCLAYNQPPHDFNYSTICKIIIGPSGDQSAIEDSIKFYLEARNYRIPVLKSNIPYRAI